MQLKKQLKIDLGITIISNFVADPAAKNNELIIIELDESYTRSFSYILPKNINIQKLLQYF